MRETPEGVTMCGEMVLPISTMSLNRINRMLRGKGSFRYTKHKNELATWVMVGKTNAKVPPADGRRHLHVIRTFKSERYRLDFDNFVGGCKPLVDSCIKSRVILGDEDRHATVSYEQVKNTTGEPDWMVVRVYDYPTNKRAPKFGMGDAVNYHATIGGAFSVPAVIRGRKFEMALGEWVYWLKDKTGYVSERALSRGGS
jgi:hypothetical protein